MGDMPIERTVTPVPKRKIIIEDDFSTGLNGWNGLLDSGDNYYPTLDPHSLSGPYSMRIDNHGILTNISAISCKRFFAFDGRHHVLFRFAWNGLDEGDLRYLRWIVDWQADDDERRWIELDYTHWNTSTDAFLGRWRVSDGNVNGMQAIDALSGYELGFNQPDKYDFHEVEFSFSAEDNGTDGRGYQWHDVRVNGTRYDVSDKKLDGTQTPEAPFANGGNLLMYVVNRDDEASHSWANVDYVRLEVEETGQ